MCESNRPRMPKHQKVFDEKTVLMTPTPIHSSSMSERQKTDNKKNSFELSNISSDADSSLGILSVKSLELSNAAERLNRERILALQSLTRCETDLTSLPSRLLRPSEVSNASSKHCYINSESTISESDLLPANSSTPRESLLTSTTNLEFARHERPLRGSLVTRLSQSIADQRYDLGPLLDEIQKTVSPDFSFYPGEQALGQLEQDEMSWKRKNDLPASSDDFSLNRPSETKMSMGSFFLKRSEPVSHLWSTSPEKEADPVPLIEVSNTAEYSDMAEDSDMAKDSFSISTIQKILSDTKQTPARAAKLLMQPKKRASSPTVRRPSAISRPSCPEKEVQSATFMKSPIFEYKEAKEKENVDVLNVPDPVFDCREAKEKKNVDLLDVSPEFNRDKSILSSRSGSSLSSLPNGKLPVATTKTELVWGCVKVGKSASQDFVIKNKSSSKIGVKCSVNNPSFRLIKEGSDFGSSAKVVLHPYESRTLAVTFAPTAQGAAVDNLYFSPINSREHLAKQFVRLFGYGGQGNVTVNNVFKDRVGKFLLPLGNLEGQEMIKKVFGLKNNGSLPSFAHVSFVSNGLYLFSNVCVTPQALVLMADEEKEVTITYTLKKEDLNHIKASMNAPVIEIGKLELLCGSEVDRGRLRKLYKKAIEKGLPTNPDFEKLLQVFPGETMPNDLKLMREPISALNDIMRLINKTEIVMTLERDLDRTLIEQLQNETAIYHSLCEETTLNNLENTACPDVFTVEPSAIILRPPEKCTDMILLNNGNTKKLYFEAMSKPEGLRLSPNRGTIQAGETVMINLTYDIVACKRITVFKVKVLVDNECFDVDVKVYLNFNKLK